MKNCYLLLIAVLLCTNLAFAYNPRDSVIHITKLPKEGIVLNAGWKFYAGDDYKYGRNDYDGVEGVAINPAMLITELPVVENAGIGWFRLTMQIDSSLRNKTIGVMLSLYGAAEIYLNEKLIYQFGKVSVSYDEEKTNALYGRALSLTFDSEEKQILAVRFSHHARNLKTKTGVIPFCLQITLLPINDAITNYAVLVKQAYQFLGIAITIELASALLTMFFFLSFRSRKEYLYFGLYFSCNFLGILAQTNLANVGEPIVITVNVLAAIQILIFVLLITGSLFHLNAAYALLKVRPTRYYRFLLMYGITSIIAMPFLPAWGSVLPSLFYPLACFELLSLYYKAARKKFPGAWILFFSIAACLALLLLLIKSHLDKDPASILVLTALTMFTPALGVVIFLAGDFARTSQALSRRINEVEALSQKNLAQEREKQEILAAQKGKLEIEVKNRTAELTQSLEELKSAQAQLVHAEKMASLGMLTAGIAHEIQNPLNFVNNFSDVNKELSEEMEADLQKGAYREALSVSATIKQNTDMIAHHGRRAESIVKSMLQHSRKSTGVKELTDINALVDEHLRLSYHGMRAKNPNFSASYTTFPDNSIKQITVVPEDIGRVLLNLFNNAFYAVCQKAKSTKGYEPQVSATTKNLGNQLEIIIKDNGGGIPADCMDKIFQPFFTTKPTGEGTGLGLSLSYDIMKAHGGNINVYSKEGEETVFVLQLPNH